MILVKRISLLLAVIVQRKKKNFQQEALRALQTDRV